MLVSNRKTGALGVAFVLRGAHHVDIVGAGTLPDGGPGDFSGVDRWSVLRQGASFDLVIHDRPGIPLRGDAVWMARPDSASAFLVFTGKGFRWDARRGW